MTMNFVFGLGWKMNNYGLDGPLICERIIEFYGDLVDDLVLLVLLFLLMLLLLLILKVAKSV